MNKFFIAICGAAVILLLLSVAKASAISINLNITDSYVQVGENFSVEILLDGQGIGENLLGYGLDVFPDAAHLSYLGYSVGPGFTDYPALPDDINTLAAPPITDDDVLLAILNFSALSLGAAELTINGPYDASFSGLYYQTSVFDIFAGTKLIIHPAGNPVPEPSTFLLLGVGCGIFGLAARRFKKNMRATG